jgi:hypothetical protein
MANRKTVSLIITRKGKKTSKKKKHKVQYKSSTKLTMGEKIGLKIDAQVAEEMRKFYQYLYGDEDD